MDTTINIKLGGLGQLKSELAGIKDQLAGLTPNTDEWTALQDKAGDIKKKITSINSGISDLSKGSNIEQATDSFKGLGESLLNLDFSGAAKQASRFQQTMGSLSAADIAKPFKSMISIVGSLSKAFISFGISLLANPIFLLVAAIVAIVVVIGVIMNKLGLLKPILDAVGKVFGLIMDVVNGVIDAFKALTDWLGLTSHAANESAQAQADAAEKTAKAHEDKSARIVQGYDHEIAMAKINGKSTEYLEKKKAFWILETMKARMFADKEAVRSAILIGDLDEEEIAKLKEKASASTLAYKGQVNSTKELIAQQSADKKAGLLKDQEEEDKATGEAKKKAQEAYKARIAAEKQFRADRLAAIRQIEDLENSLLKEGIEKELAINKTKYDRLKEDLKTNTKLTFDERKSLTELYNLEFLNSQDAINQREIDREKAKNDALLAIENEKNAVMAAKAIEQADLLFAMKEAANMTAKEKEIADAVIKGEEDLLALGMTADAEVFVAEQTKIRIAEINKTYDDAELAAQQKLMADKIAIATTYANSVNDITKDIFEISNNLGKQDVKSKEERAKRQFNISKALAVASATIEGIQSTIAAFRNGMANPIPLLGPATGAAYAVGAGVFAAANVAKIASAKYGGGGGKVSSPTPPSISSSPTSTTAATPAVNLFGANNNANTFGANKTNQPNQPMVVKAVVVESDITQMQTKATKIQQSAVL